MSYPQHKHKTCVRHRETKNAMREVVSDLTLTVDCRFYGNVTQVKVAGNYVYSSAYMTVAANVDILPTDIIEFSGKRFKLLQMSEPRGLAGDVYQKTLYLE